MVMSGTGRDGVAREGTHHNSDVLGARDVAGDGARGDHEGTRKVHLARTASAGEVPVLRAHRDLIGGIARAGTGLDAGAARRVDELGARSLEDLEVALFLRVATDVLR